MELHIYSSVDLAIRSVADYFVQSVHNAITEKGYAYVVLTGGNSPKPLYSLLASDEYRGQLDWSKIFFFFGDERHVPFTDAGHNGAMVKQLLFDPLEIPETNIFYINTSLPPEEAAKEYELKVKSIFMNRPVQFDLVLLGLGSNAHTASLFPYTDVLSEENALVKSVYVDELSANRITLTAPVINNAKEIAFLVFGADKADAVFNVLEGERDPEKYPGQLIQPGIGAGHWFLDEAAAARL
jgi:6-phosphogluconolactonase